VSTPFGGESELVGSPLARGSAVTLGLRQRGLSGWQITEPWDKNHRVIIVFLLVCKSLTPACITCTSVVARA